MAMKVELHHIKVRDLVDNYIDNDQEGVKGFHGWLDIRPKYQREFVYKEKQRNAVIETVMKRFPLSIFYWVKNGDSDYEVLDGQQRTISICRYVNGDFSIDNRYFHNLPSDKQSQILDYEIMVYFCEGTDSEKLEWFKTINIAGEPLTDQELRNAVYAGPWTLSAKSYFSKTSGPAYGIADDYMRGAPIRQEYLETVLRWISTREGISIEEYMGLHQHDFDAVPLWNYFSNVINWVKVKFPTYRKEMKGVDWGILFNQHGDRTDLDPSELERQVSKLMADDDITKPSGIYDYVLSGNESKLSIRAFSNRDKRIAYERQKGICPKCQKHFELKDMEADHITPWSKGGKTIPENCQMLCKDCNRRKSDV